MTGASPFPVRAARHIPPTGRLRSSHFALRQPTLTLVPEISPSSPPQVLNCLPLSQVRGKFLQFHSFDEAYVERLRGGDFLTQEHFVAYFSALIHVKLRSRLQSREAIEDVRQETFVRFYVALREGKIRRPDRVGSFVNSICNNVLLEHYRSGGREDSLDEDDQPEISSGAPHLLEAFTSQEDEDKVRKVLEQLPERDRRLLKELFFEEREKDQVCKDFGVDREYLRVLLHRAKKLFKALYLRHENKNDNSGPKSISA
jgi:RNA polymerase sigma-70 factor, ECF subfamily